MADYTLKELVDLLDRGLLTREEFEQQKRALLTEGMTLGAYLLGDLIGEGGHSRVFTARHRTRDFAQHQGGKVAVKVLHAHLARRPDVVSRFEREAALGIKLDHPNIVGG